MSTPQAECVQYKIITRVAVHVPEPYIQVAVTFIAGSLSVGTPGVFEGSFIPGLCIWPIGVTITDLETGRRLM